MTELRNEIFSAKYAAYIASRFFSFSIVNNTEQSFTRFLDRHLILMKQKYEDFNTALLHFKKNT